MVLEKPFHVVFNAYTDLKYFYLLWYFTSEIRKDPHTHVQWIVEKTPIYVCHSTALEGFLIKIMVATKRIAQQTRQRHIGANIWQSPRDTNAISATCSGIFIEGSKLFVVVLFLKRILVGCVLVLCAIYTIRQIVRLESGCSFIELNYVVAGQCWYGLNLNMFCVWFIFRVFCLYLNVSKWLNLW